MSGCCEGLHWMYRYFVIKVWISTLLLAEKSLPDKLIPLYSIRSWAYMLHAIGQLPWCLMMSEDPVTVGWVPPAAVWSWPVWVVVPVAGSGTTAVSGRSIVVSQSLITGPAIAMGDSAANTTPSRLQRMHTLIEEWITGEPEPEPDWGNGGTPTAKSAPNSPAREGHTQRLSIGPSRVGELFRDGGAVTNMMDTLLNRDRSRSEEVLSVTDMSKNGKLQRMQTLLGDLIRKTSNGCETGQDNNNTGVNQDKTVSKTRWISNNTLEKEVSGKLTNTLLLLYQKAVGHIHDLERLPDGTVQVRWHVSVSVELTSGLRSYQ